MNGAKIFNKHQAMCAVVSIHYKNNSPKSISWEKGIWNIVLGATCNAVTPQQNMQY